MPFAPAHEKIQVRRNKWHHGKKWRNRRACITAQSDQSLQWMYIRKVQEKPELFMHYLSSVLLNSVLNKTACRCSVKLAWFSGDPSHIHYIKIKPLKPKRFMVTNSKVKLNLAWSDQPVLAQAGLSMLSLVSEISRVMLTSPALTPQPCLGTCI